MIFFKRYVYGYVFDEFMIDLCLIVVVCYLFDEIQFLFGE